MSILHTFKKSTGKQSRSVSLRTYFAISFGLLIIIISLLLSFAIGIRSIKQIKLEAGHSLAETAYQMADKMDTFMWSRTGEIETLSQLEALKNFDDPASIQKLLNKLKESFPSFSWVGVTDRNGIVLASTGGILKGVDISKRPVFLEGRNGRYIGDVHDAVLLANLLPNPSGEAMKFVDISVPVYDENGQVQGVLAAHLSWEWVKNMEDSILKPLKERKDIDIYVISSKDHIVLLAENESIGEPLSQTVVKAIDQNENTWSVVNWNNNQYLMGYMREAGYMDYEGLGWTIIVRQPIDDAYSGARELQLYIILVGVLAALLFGVICWFLTGKISNPINRLSNMADELRLGKRKEIPQIRGIKEIELLTISLRELVNTITMNETALGEMETIAHHDYLTKLPNRTGLKKYLEAASQLDHNGDVLIFLCLDLDGFKRVNDTYGHRVGDILLQEVATRLKRFIGSDELVARLGGDEFVIVLRSSDLRSYQKAHSISEQIIKELNIPFLIEDYTVKIGCSIGGAVWRKEENTDVIMNKADQRLYHSKETGKNKATLNEEKEVSS